MGAAIFIGGAGLSNRSSPSNVIAIVTFICSRSLHVLCATTGGAPSMQPGLAYLTSVDIGGACLGTLLTIRVVAIVTFRAVLGIVRPWGCQSSTICPIRSQASGIDYACLGTFLSLTCW